MATTMMTYDARQDEYWAGLPDGREVRVAADVIAEVIADAGDDGAEAAEALSAEAWADQEALNDDVSVYCGLCGCRSAVPESDVIGITNTGTVHCACECHEDGVARCAREVADV